MQACLQDLRSQQGVQEQENGAQARQQIDEGEAELEQQISAQHQQLEDVEKDCERYKALTKKERQEAEAERAPLDAYLAEHQPKLDAGSQRCKELEQQLEADEILHRYSLIASCRPHACSHETA